MKKTLLFLATFMVAFVCQSVAQISIKGKVTDKDASPVIGATVFVKGNPKLGSVTDVDGLYAIHDIPKNSILVFKAVDFKDKEVKITEGMTVLNVTLELDGDIQCISVTATGYGRTNGWKRKKREMHFSRALQGRTKGVQVYENNTSANRKKNQKTKESNDNDYSKIVDNPFKDSKKEPLSTFSIDVDNASYSQVRSSIEQGEMPTADAVRIEELINYFDYDYEEPMGEHPFTINTEVASCPWNPENKLVHIGLQGKNLDYKNLKPSNLVFLIDVSGSMSEELSLVKKSLSILLNELSEKDKIAIVVYAGSEGLALPATPANQKDKIMEALDNLSSGGSTNGGAGIELAYKIAEENLIKDGNNRIVLCTDGDFNVGVTSTDKLVKIVEKKRQKGIYLTICGYGMGNYKDGSMEEISKNANGNYFYIDNLQEAQKVFAKEMRANMFTIAKDVKIQVEFNPKWVQAYRLIGYENRVMANEDFNDDKKDAGELGAGHTVTALYEIVPVGVKSEFASKTDDLKYQQNQLSNQSQTNELMTVKFRYKPLKKEESVLMTQVIENNSKNWENSSDNFRFSASVASFGMLLRESPYKGKSNYEQVLSLARGSKGKDDNGYRSNFVQLVELVKTLEKQKQSTKE
ncbi:MAG: von Willebrand factor type A domain-containing protein [Raineya sp.]|jgi:Ca-activated chloride channel family protein|nr:von Willebrand factor type A domain-containing protein [Raineya sp.]